MTLAAKASWLLRQLLVVCALITAAAQTPQPLSPDDPIVQFESQQVTYSTVAYSDTAIVQEFFLIHDREPTSSDAALIAELRVSAEGRSLTDTLQSMLRDVAIQRLNVAVSEQEIRQDPTDVLGDIDLGAQMEATRRRYDLLEEAISAVYEQGRGSDEVYAAMLRDAGLSKQEWNLELIRYRDPAEREVLSNAALVTEQDWLEALSATAVEKITNDKLAEAVDQAIAREDPRFAAEFPSGADTEYLTERRTMWWTHLRRDVEIKALHPQFEGVVERFIGRD